MKQLSSEFRDRPIPPLDLAIWGIEYAVRHPNGTLVTPLRSKLDGTKSNRRLCIFIL